MIIGGIDTVALAGKLRDEHGSWTLSQLSDQGLRDVIWDAEPAYPLASYSDQLAILTAVQEEIYG